MSLGLGNPASKFGEPKKLVGKTFKNTIGGVWGRPPPRFMKRRNRQLIAGVSRKKLNVLHIPFNKKNPKRPQTFKIPPEHPPSLEIETHK